MTNDLITIGCARFFSLRGEKFREAIINDVEHNIEVVTQEREKLRKIVDENKVGLI